MVHHESVINHCQLIFIHYFPIQTLPRYEKSSLHITILNIVIPQHKLTVPVQIQYCQVHFTTLGSNERAAQPPHTTDQRSLPTLGTTP